MTGEPAHFSNADALADSVIGSVGRDIVLALPLGLGKANNVANALYHRAARDMSIRLTILTALTLERPRPGSELERRFLEPIIERLCGDYPQLAYAQALREGSLPPNVEVSEFFLMAGRWLGIAHAQRNHVSANYTHVLDVVLSRGVNVVAQLVAKRRTTSEFRYSLSSNTDLTLDLARARLNGEMSIAFVGEVNDEMPFMPGEADLPAAAFSHVLDSPESHFSLFATPRMPVKTPDHACGLHVARLVPDGGTLQIGIGSIGDAVANALILRHNRNAAYRESLERLIPDPGTRLRQDAPFEAGLYGNSEMLVDAFLALIEAGVLKREVNGALIHAAFFLGSRDFYCRLRAMSDEDRAKVAMTSVSFTNDLYGDEDAKRRARVGARFVNNAMMATLMGAVVSDGLEDGRAVSGVGGQYNFVAQAFALRGARSIITLKATRKKEGETVSNIRWSYGHTTIPRHLRDIVVTEYGIADLRGKTDRDTIAAMLSVTDSRFQNALLETAKSAGKIERDYRIPSAYRSNTPEALAEKLKPAREKGLIPDYPFGSDFTETEQRLMPALEVLKEWSQSRLSVARMAAHGALSGQPDAETQACLERMSLDKPSSARERIYQALLKAALAETSGTGT